MAEKVTSLQVAQLAGVSQSAVSRVFTPGASVSKKTEDKVRKAAAELGYRPNVLARAMVSGKSRIIGLVVGYLENYFYPEALEKLSNALQEQGYHVLIFMASRSAGNIDDVMEEILDYQVDGVVLASVPMSSDIAMRCQQAGVPVVLFNRTQDLDGITTVASDNYAGGRKVAEFLLAGGHKRIAYVAGWQGASTQRDREAGFRAALTEGGQDVFAHEVGDFHTENARAAARRMFDVAPEKRPDAVFVANDHMALAVMDVIRFELGLRVPEDVSVIGYDDVPPAGWPAYNLTTIRQRANLMVAETVTALLDHIDTPATAKPRKVAIDGPLIVRTSARLPKGWEPQRTET
ncbi:MULTISPECIES: LacI family DNA-binding transcriptional regulator [unclassified Ruegeria]|uniref:LacI family DNA-binding transcriptional regulator n=1 Tax=unclassified Ruegeria TaxID=2625375 RepID=UPI001ADAF5D2|nr:MULTISPECIES: LacI family DNA-binding transcriptional regulator [unclassified Ruegeria]MBO9411949.1 LacI family DNA-binding transcriptional regulator [Ruegeria sp. R8_1]MBO9417058.1 LacI family DNA-binding transcriptional regulator [Ruegeria sp. R8_2]